MWSWRGWVLLHASKQTDRHALRISLMGRTIRGREPVTGAVVGVARLFGAPAVGVLAGIAVGVSLRPAAFTWGWRLPGSRDRRPESSKCRGA
ncbi:hypothetical protein [Streptomyces brasiliensis]|uniref:Uncharacterized protein n=1 Tax=Streptomyces brasiliensis TaxID=1954 RepID=A0A917P0F1_9ACTN|nr:hypothetical protein [Streptomyces brasiliensis]GGJ42136.1 hypothetical protein GCM10010121_061530 [Streptomyces brasiliensis]